MIDIIRGRSESEPLTRALLLAEFAEVRDPKDPKKILKAADSRAQCLALALFEEPGCPRSATRKEWQDYIDATLNAPAGAAPKADPGGGAGRRGPRKGA